MKDRLHFNLHTNMLLQIGISLLNFDTIFILACVERVDLLLCLIENLTCSQRVVLFVHCLSEFSGPLGIKTRICPPCPHAHRNRRLKRGVSRNSYKKGGPVSVLGRAREPYVEPYEMSMALGA